jgi:hypothetical protein
MTEEFSASLHPVEQFTATLTEGGGGIPGPPGPEGPQGPQGDPGASTSVFYFIADTTHTGASDPGSGKIRWNNSDPTAATFLYIDWLTSDGFDVTVLFRLMNPPEQIVVQDKDLALNYQVYQLTGPAIMMPDWFQVPVLWVESGGTGAMQNNKGVAILVVAEGSPGPPGPAGPQTPWTLDVDAANHKLQNVSEIDMALSGAGASYAIFRNGATPIWYVGVTNPITGIANGGADLTIYRMADDGSYLNTPLIIHRNTGVIELAYYVSIQHGNNSDYSLNVVGDINCTGAFLRNSIPIPGNFAVAAEELTALQAQIAALQAQVARLEKLAGV